MKSNYILALFVLTSIAHSSIFGLYQTLSLTDNLVRCQVSPNGELVAILSQSKTYLYSNDDTALAPLQDINFQSFLGVGFTNDGLTFVTTESNVGAKVFRRNNASSLFSLDQTIAGANSTYACITGDGKYLAFAQDGDMKIYSENNTQAYDQLQSFADDQFGGCTFSDDGTFLFLFNSNVQVRKYNGSSFENHQNITMAERIRIFAKPVFRSPYLITLTGDGNLNGENRFYSLNPNTDQWGIVFQRTIAGLNTFMTFDASFDHKFIGIGVTTSEIYVEEGSIAGGYTEGIRIAQFSTGFRFTPNSKFLIVPTANENTIFTYLNCNWNTSGNFYFNSNTSTCQQCPSGCLACSAADDCSQCDETSNYFHDGNRTCNLCTPANCLTCDSLTTCTACESGYQAEGNSTCVVIPGPDGSTDGSTATEDSVDLSPVQIVWVVIGVMVLTGMLSVLTLKMVSLCTAKATVPTDRLEESMGKIA